VASAPTLGPVAELPKPGDLAAVPYLTAGTAAWLCAIPCAVVVLVAVLVLGPPLGDLLNPDRVDYRFLRAFQREVHPEPTEQGRFLLALTFPLLLSWAAATLRARWRRPSSGIRAGVIGTQLALAALLVACVLAQYGATYGPTYVFAPVTIGWDYFTPATLAAAAAIAALSSLALQRIEVRRLARTWLRESPPRRAVAVAIAVAMTAVWLLTSINTDTSVANEPWQVSFHLSFTLDEAFAVVNGRTPLVDFSPQYGSLWPWVGALAMIVFGKTLLVFTIAMCSITAVALLAIYDVLRRVTRNALLALLLYLPLLATSLYMVRGTSLNRDTFATYFGVFPLRYAGAYLLAWLTARQLEQRGARAGAWPLFVAAGLVLINNLEFGIAALGASVAAILWTSRRDRRSLLRLCAGIAAGLLAALALVSLLTLVRAGSLPRLSRLTDYAELYASGGFGMLPIREPLGLHLATYLTYVAAIATATVRAVERAPNRVLTGMLAWSGVFGLGAGGYFVGRSHPEVLIASFSAWAFALVLLTVAVVSRLAADPPRRPSLATFLVLFGLGIAICSLAQTPAPWTQLTRFGAPFTPEVGSISERPLLPEPGAKPRRFVSSLADGPSRFVTKPGAPVAILAVMSHRIADIYGIVDVSPYTNWNSMETEERIEATVDALREAGGNTVIVPREVDPGIFFVLARHGFKVLTASGRLERFGPRHGVAHVDVLPWQEVSLTKWVDTRHLHPRALG
jgi:hypothetical protein